MRLTNGVTTTLSGVETLLPFPANTASAAPSASALPTIAKTRREDARGGVAAAPAIEDARSSGVTRGLVVGAES